MHFPRTFSLVILHLTCLSLAQQECLLTDTTCQCSSSAHSGTCTHSQGNGLCLLGKSAVGSRFDCLGYEKCSISRCGKHLSAGDARVSDNVPFRCAFDHRAGTRTGRTGFMDTIQSTKNAESDASVSQDEATEAAAEIVRLLDELLIDQMSVNDMMIKVDEKGTESSGDDLRALEADASAVHDAAVRAGNIAKAAIDSTKICATATLEVRRSKRDAELYNTEVAKKKSELEFERESVGPNQERIKRLGSEMEYLNRKLSEAAADCSKQAVVAREQNMTCLQKLKESRIVRQAANNAYARFVQKSREILEKTEG